MRVVSVRDPWLESPDLDVIVKSGALAGQARVLDLKDKERALVWIDGRLAAIRGAGLYALWSLFRDVRVEVVDSEEVLFEHRELGVILRAPEAPRHLEALTVAPGQVGLLYVNGRHTKTLEPGRYAYWREVAGVEVRVMDLRQQVTDIAGQDIMTADKVTLRLNAVLTFRLSDPEKAASAVDSWEQAIYRQAQLALRSVVGTRDLDSLLSAKDEVAQELLDLVRDEAAALGVRVENLGIRDIILPGDMKEILNRVTEANKAAEAHLITRREETAAMRSQANTARLLESNPTLMRLRELEVLEKVAHSANLNVVLGDGGLADRVIKLL